MILRSSVVRHGRQALSTSPRRALATLPTSLADHPAASNPGGAADAASAAPELKWVAPKMSPLARWHRKKHVVLDPQPAHGYLLRVRLEKALGRLGADPAGGRGTAGAAVDPGALLRSPPRPADVTLELLLAAQCHMGHHRSLWNPAMQRYIYGVRAGIHVIALEETAAALRRAAKVIEEVAFLGGLILVVGNRRGQMEVTARAAELAGACHLFTKWVPGTITNRDQILAKEPLQIVGCDDEPVEGFEKHLLERRPVMPELVIVLNPLENYTLLHECAQENIPTIGLVDTNGDPTKVTYTIPCNDDSLRAVSVVAGVLGRAGEAGQKRRRRAAARGVCTWRNPPEIQRWIQMHLTDTRAETDEEFVARREREAFAQQDDGPPADDPAAWQQTAGAGAGVGTDEDAGRGARDSDNVGSVPAAAAAAAAAEGDAAAPRERPRDGDGPRSWFRDPRWAADF